MNIRTDSGPATRIDRMHPELEAFIANGDMSDAAVSNWLAGRGAPLAEEGALTFLWQGEADAVSILRWIHAGVDAQPFARIPGGNLWHLRLPVQDEGRFEYKLNIARHGHETWILDPANAHRAGDPFGENSVAMTLGYRRPEWSMDRGAPRGSFEPVEIESASFGQTRTEKVYLPAGYQGDVAHPLVIIHDGGDFDDYADLTISLDNLIASGDIPPVVAVLIRASDRISEYPRGRRHARYVVSELLPAITARYKISDRARDRILLGASLGAVASLATAFRFPGVFGGLILKSGSFVLNRARLKHRTHPVFHRVARLVQVLHRAPNLPETRAFVSTGELEGLADENRALASFLELRGVDVLFKSSWDGHHWHNWRDQLRDALTWVLRAERDY